MDKFFSFIKKCELKGRTINNIRQLPNNLFPETHLVTIRFLLEERFSPRKFTLKEIKALLDEVFPEDLVKKGNKLIPKWYKDKYFNG